MQDDTTTSSVPSMETTRPDTRGQRRTSPAVVSKEKRQEACWLIKGKSCNNCGLNGVPKFFDHHHRDPSKKLFTLGGSGFNMKWSRVLVELEKTDMLCPNCHREEHLKDGRGYGN